MKILSENLWIIFFILLIVGSYFFGTISKEGALILGLFVVMAVGFLFLEKIIIGVRGDITEGDDTALRRIADLEKRVEVLEKNKTSKKNPSL